MKNENKIKELQAQAAATEGDAKGFMNPEPPKRGRGRPRKEQVSSGASSAEQSSPDQRQAPTAPNVIPTAQIVKPLVGVVSRLGANFVCPSTHPYHQRMLMTQDETEVICHSLGLVLDKWMPSAMSKWGPEIALSVALGQYGMRIMAAKAVVESEKKKAEAMAKAAAQPGSGTPRMEVPPPSTNDFQPPVLDF